MKLTELLEEEKDGLLRAVRAAPSKEEAREAIERTLERMLYAFNDAAPGRRAQENAAAMIGALKAALPLAESAGTPRILERRKGKGLMLTPLSLVLLILGCALCVAAGGWMLYSGLPALSALLPVLGGALLAVAGAVVIRGLGTSERIVEQHTDWDKVYHTLHTAALVMDQTLDDAAAAERWEARRKAETDPALSPTETELMAELLEGLYGGDGDYALEKLGAVRRYLRGKGIETVDFDSEHAQMFDRMPGAAAATLCPALVQSGTLLRRGLATVPER